LLMMAGAEDWLGKTGTELDDEPLSMLVNCGYDYIMSPENDLTKPIPNFIAAAVIKTSISKRFYLRDDHNIFPAILIGYADSSPQVDFFRLVAGGDDDLLQIVFRKFHELFIGGLIKYQSKETKAKLATLVQYIPKERMGSKAAVWEQIQLDTKQYIPEKE